MLRLVVCDVTISLRTRDTDLNGSTILTTSAFALSLSWKRVDPVWLPLIEICIFDRAQQKQPFGSRESVDSVGGRLKNSSTGAWSNVPLEEIRSPSTGTAMGALNGNPSAYSSTGAGLHSRRLCLNVWNGFWNTFSAGGVLFGSGSGGHGMACVPARMLTQKFVDVNEQVAAEEPVSGVWAAARRTAVKARTASSSTCPSGTLDRIVKWPSTCQSRSSVEPKRRRGTRRPNRRRRRCRRRLPLRRGPPTRPSLPLWWPSSIRRPTVRPVCARK